MRVRIHFSKGFFPLLISSLLVILCLTGCAEDSNILDNGQSRQLEFSVTTHNWSDFSSSNKSSDQKVSSRATPISGNVFDTSKGFNVIADVNEGGNWSTEVNNETASYSTANNIWQTSATHYWPGTGSTVDFYAYYPTSISSNIAHTSGSIPVLSYTVPDNAADQIDILASSETGVVGDSYSQIPVDFKHIFTVVQFRVGSSGLPSGTITKVTLNNIQYKGTYSLDGTWTPNTTDKKSFSQTVSVPTSTGTAITSGTTTFMMMPQILDNASVTVTYSNGGKLTQSITGTWSAGKMYTYNISKTISVANFDYTGNVQTYTVPLTGTYKIECWGAQGGSTYAPGGKGGYTCGNLQLSKGIPLYIYIGPTTSGISPVFNCGSSASTGGSVDVYISPGGGATDVRLQNGDWNDFNSLKSRIIVAAGGGGGAVYSNSPQIAGGYAGGLQAGPTKYVYYLGGSCLVFDSKNGVTVQTSTNGPIKDLAEEGYSNNNGKLVTSTYSIFGNYNNPPVGCGSGYYGGINYGECDTVYNGMGGSSFISGYIGCNAIKESSTVDNIVHTGLPDHYSGYIFTNSIMIAGNAQMPSPSGSTETGHAGNGYARITFVSAN